MIFKNGGYVTGQLIAARCNIDLNDIEDVQSTNDIENVQSTITSFASQGSTGMTSTARSKSAQSRRDVIEIDSPGENKGERSGGGDRVATNEMQDALSESASEHVATLEVSC
jgi:hypothetical protein